MMKSIKSKLIIIIIFLFFIGTSNIKADLTDYNDGESGSLSNLGSGAWWPKYVGLKISIADSTGKVEDSEIIVNENGVESAQYDIVKFSSQLKPKLTQKTTIKWKSSSSVRHHKSSLLPDNWKDSNSNIINLHQELSANNNKLLEQLLAMKYTNSSGNKVKVFQTASQGDYVIVEPMVFIDGYYGTAFELLNSFDDIVYNADGSTTWGPFIDRYSGAVFGGSYKYPNGGVLYSSIFLSENIPVLGLTVYGSSDDAVAPAKLSYRNKCLKTATCGRGLGVYKYDDIIPPQEKSFDISLVINGTVKHTNFKGTTYGTATFKVNGTTKFQNAINDYSGKHLVGTTYEFSNITASTGWTYLGYSLGIDSDIIKSDNFSGNINNNVTVFLHFNNENCETKLQQIIDSGKTPEKLFELYKDEKAAGRDYRNLLWIENPSCTVYTPPKNEISNLTCLSASTLSHADFNEVKFNRYDEIITNSQGDYVGFCLTSMYLKNNLGVQKFYSKAGQFLVKEEYDELKIYNKELNPVRVCGTNVATTTIRKVCYVIKGSNPVNANYKSNQDVNVYFGDNDFNGNTEKLPSKSVENELKVEDKTNGMVMYEYEKNIYYSLNNVYFEKLTGKVTTKQLGTISAKGISSKFTPGSGFIPFHIQYNGKQYGTTDNLCAYKTTPELTTSQTLAIEFRSVDTNNPFNRNTNSNWSNGSDNSKNNDVVKNVIKESNNSYNKTGEGPKYKITLTNEDIRNIREYNKNELYDNNKRDCKTNEEGNVICKNTFVENLKKGIIVLYDEDGKVKKSLSNSTKLDVNNDISSNKILINNSSISEDIEALVNKKICTLKSKTNGKQILAGYNMGDEYLCEVKPGVNYTFYVVSACGNNKINMIMDRNVSSQNNYWINESDYINNGGIKKWKDTSYIKSEKKSYDGDNSVGPITSLKILKEHTDSWSNIVAYNYTLIDEKNDFINYNNINYYRKDQKADKDPDVEMYSPIELEDVRARMLTRNEANACGCSREIGSCPAFLKTNLNSTTKGYWLSDAASAFSSNSLDIANDGGQDSLVTRDYNGVRPVITVYTSQIN